MQRPATRHIITLGQVRRKFLEAAVEIWQPDKVDQPLCASESVLLLVGQESTTPAQYIQALRDVDRHCSTVGVIPVCDDVASLAYIERFLSQEVLQVDFTRSRFRLYASAEANLPTAPPVLRRARHDDQPAVAEDLEMADLLFLQGHAGPVDGGFGPWLTFCSRHLHQPGKSPLYPCFGTDRCFRQEIYGRTPTSIEGLVNPAALRSPLLVLDGCNTLTVPGSLFKYETSIARSVVASEVRAAVLTHGVSATPLSAIIVLLAMLARGRTLSEAIREANHHRQEMGSPSSIQGLAVAPWILVGNPDVRVHGLPLIEAVPQVNGSIEFPLDERDIPAETGVIVAVNNVSAADGPFDVACGDGRWARGALHSDGNAYVWVSGKQIGPERESRPEQVTVALPKRPPDPTADWRRRSLWLRANRGWLENMAAVVVKRGGDEYPLRSVISLWDSISGPIEQVAFAVSPHRDRAIPAPLAASTSQLVEMIEQIDRATALTIADAVPLVGARLTRLWTPQWLSNGYAKMAELCSCGCPLVGVVQRHASLGLVRIQLECPACGPLGNVSTRTHTNAHGLVEVTPAVIGVPPERCVARGATLTWPVQRLCDEQVAGFACAALFDPFRQKRVVTDVYDVAPLSVSNVEVTIPDDWPEGLSQAVIVVTAGVEMSFIDFDIIVRAG